MGIVYKIYRKSVVNAPYFDIVFGCCNYARYLLYRQETTQYVSFSITESTYERDRDRKDAKLPVYIFITLCLHEIYAILWIRVVLLYYYFFWRGGGCLIRNFCDSTCDTYSPRCLRLKSVMHS